MELTFTSSSGSGAQQSFPVPIIDDDAKEPTETFYVIASTSDPDTSFSPAGNESSVSIIDNDGKFDTLYL